MGYQILITYLFFSTARSSDIMINYSISIQLYMTFFCQKILQLVTISTDTIKENDGSLDTNTMQSKEGDQIEK